MAGIGKGRFLGARHVAILERHDGEAWREVGRYGSVRDADRALDEAVGNGDTPDSLRVIETHTTSNVVVVVAAVIAIVLAAAIVVYVVFG